MKINKIIKYLAPLLIGVGPFVLDTWFGLYVMIAGITLINVEFVKNKQWHLVALNVTSIIGYIITLINR